MATWQGRKPTKYEEDADMTYVNTEVVWNYNTTSDTLTLSFKQDEYSDYTYHPAKEFEQLMSAQKAMVMLEQLADWCNIYQGPEELDKIINKVKKE